MRHSDVPADNSLNDGMTFTCQCAPLRRFVPRPEGDKIRDRSFLRSVVSTSIDYLCLDHGCDLALIGNLSLIGNRVPNWQPLPPR
jgi:hypothetical protein